MASARTATQAAQAPAHPACSHLSLSVEAAICLPVSACLAAQATESHVKRALSGLPYRCP